MPLRRTLPLLLLCSCGARTALPTDIEECPLASSTVTRLGGPGKDPFAGLSLDRDGNAILAHGVELVPTTDEFVSPDHTMVHTLDPDGCLRTLLIHDGLESVTAGTAGSWFATDWGSELVELSTAGERLASWRLLAFTGQGHASVQSETPVAVPGGRALVCAGVRGKGAEFLGTPLNDLGAIHVAIFSPDRTAPLARLFPVTHAETQARRVQCKAAWSPDGRVVAVASVAGTIDVYGEPIVAEGDSLLWLELDEDLDLLTARVLDDVFGWPNAVGRAGADGSVYVGGSDENGEGVVARLGPGGDTIWRASLGTAWARALAVEPTGAVQYLALVPDEPVPKPAGASWRSHQVWGRISADGEPDPARTVVRYERRPLPVGLELDESDRPILAGELRKGDHLELPGAGRATEAVDGIFLARFDEYPPD